uniref:Uncharacterized protein n=1 Tax=Branchiostoma floridae TaxID=7739 RepID=C3ZNR7_BRAFL|eukprot:XP_002589788.1 hypothetical protein BRAFLDRAFT_125892 [Branchiostoma floridae]
MAAREKMLLLCAVFSAIFFSSVSAAIPHGMLVEDATSPMAVKMEKALEETILVEVQEEALAEQIPGELEDKVIKVELKVTVHKGQVKVNDLPVITPGITHLTCDAQIFQPTSEGKLTPQGVATVGVRLLVLQRGAKQLHIEEEVTSVNGTTVLQGVVHQVLIVLSVDHVVIIPPQVLQGVVHQVLQGVVHQVLIVLSVDHVVIIPPQVLQGVVHQVLQGVVHQVLIVLSVDHVVIIPPQVLQGVVHQVLQGVVHQVLIVLSVDHVVIIPPQVLQGVVHQVLQGVVHQVLIVLSEKQKELKRMVSHVKLEHSKVHQLSADSVVHVAKQVIKTSTMGHAEMTSNQQEAVDIAPEISTEEVAAPGKLPETPLRADPPLKPTTFHSLCSRMEELRNQMCVAFRQMCDEFNLQSFYVRLLTLCLICAMTVVICLSCVKAFCPGEELSKEEKIKLGMLCEQCELKHNEERYKVLKQYELTLKRLRKADATYAAEANSKRAKCWGLWKKLWRVTSVLFVAIYAMDTAAVFCRCKLPQLRTRDMTVTKEDCPGYEASARILHHDVMDNSTSCLKVKALPQQLGHVTGDLCILLCEAKTMGQLSYGKHIEQKLTDGLLYCPCTHQPHHVDISAGRETETETLL